MLMTDILEGSTVTYTCNAGYRLEGETTTRMCVLTAERVPAWTGSIPQCICKLVR